MSAAELARRIKVPVNRLTEILNGCRTVTGNTALWLGHFFGTSGDFWLNCSSAMSCDTRSRGRVRRLCAAVTN